MHAILVTNIGGGSLELIPQFRDCPAIPADIAGVWLGQATEDAQQGGFAAAIMSRDMKTLATGNAETQITKQGAVTA